jgi:hypothetical protein
MGQKTASNLDKFAEFFLTSMTDQEYYYFAIGSLESKPSRGLREYQIVVLRERADLVVPARGR